jgi:hypothetical protein
MTILRAFAIILGSAGGFGLAGTAIGVLLATATPDYYPTVYGAGRRGLTVDPLQMGIALGLSQGAVCGLIVGMVVVLAVAVASRRQPAATQDPGQLPGSFWGSDEKRTSTAVQKPQR